MRDALPPAPPRPPGPGPFYVPIRGKIKEYFEEAINWERRPDALSEWDDPKARRRRLSRSSENRLAAFPSDEEYPRLWQVLDRILRNRLHFVNDDLLIEANAQRLMLLSAYVAIQLQLPVDQAVALIAA